MSRVLFATSEVDPLIKTGGLADVSAALPDVMNQHGIDCRLILPATAEALVNLECSTVVAELSDVGSAPLVRIHEGKNPGQDLPVYLVEAPGLLDRAGTPYGNEGHDWHDNAERFAVFAHAVVRLCKQQTGIAWQPELVHCNDWATGLIPALLAEMPNRPGIVFTIHNLAYQGVYPFEALSEETLPDGLRHSDKLEFHGKLSFLKAGLAYADRLTTVSPTYAREIQNSSHGCGLDGLLRDRHEELVGITNGIDNQSWNAATDEALVANFDAKSLHKRILNKRALARSLNLPDTEAPMLAFIGRLAEQKGVALILDALHELQTRDIQLVALGAGDPGSESRLLEAARQSPFPFAVRIGVDARLARLIYAGTDILLVPSNYEPCGLCQLYAQRYGAVPIVHRTGGLADTVIDATESTLQDETATGFMFDDHSPAALIASIDRALQLMRTPHWSDLQRSGMSADFSWAASAKAYKSIYHSVLSR